MSLSNVLQQLHFQARKIASFRAGVWEKLGCSTCSCTAKFVVEYDRFKDRTGWQLTKEKERITNMENFKPLKKYETEREYPEGSLVYWHSLGEESYGLIIATPDGEYHTEEIPLYGGEPRYYKQVCSVQEGLDVVKGFT